VPIVVIIVQWWRVTSPEQRGFEVKLNAGEEPVLKEKEKDHG